jgi:ADP-ribose pyrophosphatase YjhB (NUDIX family)
VQTAVGAVVVRGDGWVLVIRRGRPPRKGEWSLPGGRPEAGENLAAACAREVFEETGIDIVVERLLEIVTVSAEGYSYAIHEHLGRPTNDAAAPRAGDDALDARWAHPSELDALGLSEAAIAVVARALAARAPGPA